MAIGNWSINQKTTGGLALVLGILAGMGASSCLDFDYRKIEAGLRNTCNVLKSNQELIYLVTDAETGQLSYLLTPENCYLLQAINTNQGQQLRQIYKLSNEIAIAEDLAVAVVAVKLS